MQPDVIVLGCGPAGLLAAQAAVDGGYKTTVLSRKQKSPLWGCQYLHQPIPGLTTMGTYVKVDYRLLGTSMGYREKVYGDGYAGRVSPEEYEKPHLAWDLRKTYDELWDRWSCYVLDVPFRDGETVRAVLSAFYETNPHLVVISTIPAMVLCMRPEHNFASAPVWAMGDSDTQRVPVRAEIISGEPNVVLCNGDPDQGWYRASHVLGYGTVEWPFRPERRKPPFNGVALVQKPIKTNCNCNDRVVRAGRYGKWEKGVLTHQVYQEVTELLGAGVQARLFDV